MWDYGYMGHDYFWHPLVSLLWLAVIVAAGIVAFRSIRNPRWHQGGRGALDLLRERYAKGEISTEEFEERKKTLEKE